MLFAFAPAENVYKNIEPQEIEKFYIDGLLDPED
jgi:hypothetical protein